MEYKIFDAYVVKGLFITTTFIAVTLAVIILMTQSLKFLELIINAGASGKAFWMLAFLALPRFFEVILPIAFMIAGLVIYNRMTSDNEIIVMRAAGYSPLQMAKPAFTVGILIVLLLFFIMTWLSPLSLAHMQKMRQVIKAQYSTLLFQDGVFNEIDKNLTVYIDKRNAQGELEGVLIYDDRPENPAPVTIVAQRGIVVATEEGQQVLVYAGSRQDFNKRTGALNRLDFKRYSIDLPDSVAVQKRWKEPDERTFFELFNPDPDSALDQEHKREFLIEANRRAVASFLPLTFISVVLCFLLLGDLNRRGQAYRILAVVITVVLLQSFFLSLSNFAETNMFGVFLLYFIVFSPLIFCILSLSMAGESLRQKFVMIFKNKTLGVKSV